jgi:prolyl 4-hydroxylase
MILNITPLICYFDDFISEEDRLHIISLAEKQVEPSTVCAPDKVESVFDPGRTSNHTFIPTTFDDTIISLTAKISKFANLHPATAEPLQVVRYEVGEEYKPHYDAWDYTEQKNWQGKAGQRILTALLYLNEVEEGGNTIFPNLDLEIDPRPGRIVFFHNVWPANPHRHPQALHGGAPVTKGTKWVCNLWFRERIWENAD